MPAPLAPVPAAAFGIWHGIATVVRADKERAAALEQQREADLRRHIEAMAALKALVRGMEVVIAPTAPAAAGGSA